jgi:hypothetical protein
MYVTSYNGGGAGALAGMSVGPHDAFALRFTLLSINGQQTPTTSALAGALINSSHSLPSSTDNRALTFAAPTATSTTFSNASNVEFIGFVMRPAGLPSTGGTIRLLVEPATGAVQLPSLTDRTAPFGTVDTPGNNASVYGAIPVTGWALDNTHVRRIDIWRSPMSGEPTASNGLVFIGTATFIDGARPDIAAAYPNTPNNTRAGWGYMLLTNVLPNGGNGPYMLHAFAEDDSGNRTKLGARAIIGTNSASTKPFGTIDKPGQGETISGASYQIQGWALTPQPSIIPTNGSTIKLFIDGQQRSATATYNLPRADVTSLFPNLRNSAGPGARFTFNTTTLTNGIHSIAWVATDDGGHAEGLGSRYFWVQSGAQAAMPASSEKNSTVELRAARSVFAPVQLTFRTGFNLNDPLKPVEGIILMEQAGRLELHGVGEPRKMPAGSSYANGVFYWQPPPAFLGDHELLFDNARVVVRIPGAGPVTGQ